MTLNVKKFIKKKIEPKQTANARALLPSGKWCDSCGKPTADVLDNTGSSALVRCGCGAVKP